MPKLKSDCVCYYCLKRKRGTCGLMSSKVKKCKLFIYVEGKPSGISVSLRAAKRIDSLMGGFNGNC
jgi:hypothetical protein